MLFLFFLLQLYLGVCLHLSSFVCNLSQKQLAYTTFSFSFVNILPVISMRLQLYFVPVIFLIYCKKKLYILWPKQFSFSVLLVDQKEKLWAKIQWNKTFLCKIPSHVVFSRLATYVTYSWIQGCKNFHSIKWKLNLWVSSRPSRGPTFFSLAFRCSV